MEEYFNSNRFNDHSSTSVQLLETITNSFTNLEFKFNEVIDYKTELLLRDKNSEEIVIKTASMAESINKSSTHSLRRHECALAAVENIIVKKHYNIDVSLGKGKSGTGICRGPTNLFFK